MNKRNNERAMTDTNDADSEAVLYHEEQHPFWLPLLVLVAPIIPFFWKYKVTVTSNELSFGYSTSLTSKTISLQPNSSTRIIAVNTIDVINGLFDWGGYGIRLKSLFSFTPCGYICRNGPGLEVTVCKDRVDIDDSVKRQSQQQTYVFNCIDPHLVQSLLSKYLTK